MSVPLFLARLLVGASLFLGSFAPASAQTAPGSGSPPVAAKADPTKAALEGARLELEQTEAALKRENLSGTDLQSLRARVDPVGERLGEILAQTSPQFADAKARLDQLGPKPKEGAPAESPEIARDRADRESALAELDDRQRLARALELQTEQLTSQISDRRRASFTKALLERSYSLVSPDVWLATARSFPRDLRSLGIVIDDTLGRFSSRLTLPSLTVLALALGLFIALHLVRRRLVPRLVRRKRDAAEVTRRKQVVKALGVLVTEATPAALGSFLLFQLLAGLDVLPPRIVAVAASLLTGVAFIAFVRAVVDALLAPDRQPWRLLPVSDAEADRTMSFAIAISAVLVAGKVLDGLNQAIAAGLPLSVLTRGLTAILCALILAELLRRFSRAEGGNEACLGPYVPTDAGIGGPVRVLGWALVGLTLGSAVFGYVALSAFLVDQLAWTASLAALLYLGIVAADVLIAGNLSGEGRVVTALQANLGVRRRSLEQIGVLTTGVTRVVLVVAAAMLALAPWGIESGDLLANLRAAFFGFKVGDVSISLATTMAAIGLFALVIAATRVVQRWFANTFLPTTDLDAGLRNSIGTAIGYLGFFAAAALAFSYVGLGLDKIAIVAGALSVGIGFGLQSIVNNFVSGLILLWERPIRVGDLVVIGDGEGYVRRISVRATEIETFDRSSVIIPNSNLISGVVRNKVRGDRTGRVVIPINVLRNQDPARAAELLIADASRHADVLSDPPPRVVFRKIGDTFLEFDLVCFVEDVTKQLRVQSDLNFSVFRTLVDAGIIPPLGPGAMNIGGLEQVQAALRQIAESIATADAARTAPADEGRRSPDPLRVVDSR